MMNKLKNNLTYVFCAGLGLLNFILLAIPYVASFYSYDYGYGKISDSMGISGYKVMDMWSLGFGGVMSAIIQIIILLLGIALLAYGILGLLKAFNIFGKLPDKIGKFETVKLGKIALFAYGILNVLLFIFLIIVTASNTERAEGSAAGIKLSAGIFITIIIAAGVIIGLKFLEKKNLASQSGESVAYVCSNCGKAARAKDKFCNDCGGAIIKKQPISETTNPQEQVTEQQVSSLEATIDDVVPKE